MADPAPKTTVENAYHLLEWLHDLPLNIRRGGFPFSNMAVNELGDMTPQEFTDALRALESAGYIKLRGPRTLADLAALVDEKSAAKMPFEPGKGQTNASELFNDENGFFETLIHPTLRGHFAIALDTFTVAPPPALDLTAARQALDVKRHPEKYAREAAAANRDFDTVLRAVFRGVDVNSEEWRVKTQHWDDNKWKTYKAHQRLLEDPSYKSAFSTLTGAAAKVFGASKNAESFLYGWRNYSAFSNVMSMALCAHGVRHPVGAVQFQKSLEKLSTLYLASPKP